jgi:F0F1-type ATP synthase delta subunit
MKTPRHTVAAALAQRSLSARDGHKFGEEIAAFLLQERRSGELEPLLRDIMQYRTDHGIVEVIAVSAFPLSETVRKDIIAQIREMYPKAREIIISQRHDNSIVGGVRLEFANQQLDLSIRNKLNRLKQLTAHKSQRQ